VAPLARLSPGPASNLWDQVIQRILRHADVSTTLGFTLRPKTRTRRPQCGSSRKRLVTKTLTKVRALVRICSQLMLLITRVRLSKHAEALWENHLGNPCSIHLSYSPTLTS
jgi:hypothetical protein